MTEIILAVWFVAWCVFAVWHYKHRAKQDRLEEERELQRWRDFYGLPDLRKKQEL